MKEVSDGSLNSNDSGGPSEESTDGIEDEHNKNLLWLLRSSFSYGRKLFAGEHVSSESSMNETSDGSLNSNDSGCSSAPPYIVPAQNSLSRSQKKIVKAKVQAIQSQVPIYVVIMRRSSIAVYKTKLVSPILILY